MLAIKLLVNPPCQHTQQRDDNDGAKNGTHYTATAVALHWWWCSFFALTSSSTSGKGIFISLAKIIKFHTFNNFKCLRAWMKLGMRKKRLWKMKVLSWLRPMVVEPSSWGELIFWQSLDTLSEAFNGKYSTQMARWARERSSSARGQIITYGRSYFLFVLMMTRERLLKVYFYNQGSCDRN